MKTLISCSVAGLVLFVNATYAGGGLEGFGVPSNMDFYGGGSIGMASEDGACNAVNGATNCNDSSTGYKVFAGVRLNPQNVEKRFTVGENGVVNSSTLPALGVEGGYINFGESSANGVILSPRSIPIGTSSSSSETSGAYLSAVGYMPVAPRTELIGKAGLLYWSQDGKVDAPADPTKNDSSSKSGLGTILGAGAQYQLNDNLSIRGEYEKAFGVGNDTRYETEPSLLSVGAVFSTL